MDRRIYIEPIDEVHMRVSAERSIMMEIYDHFSFQIPNHRFHPKVKAELWDGIIKLYNLNTERLYCGLIEELKDFASIMGYEIHNPHKIFQPVPLKQRMLITENFGHIIAKKLGFPFELHDHQNLALTEVFATGNRTLLSATNSGKSAIIYLYCRFITDIMKKKNALILVDTKILANQMKENIEEFSNGQYDAQIITGTEKNKKLQSDLPTCAIATWQGIYKKPESFFNNFGVIVADEVHKYQATCTKQLMEKTKNTKFKMGTTGTIEESKTHEFVLQGLFGPILKVASNEEMIERGVSVKPDMKCLLLKHDVETRNKLKSKDKDGKTVWATYQEEIDLIIKSKKRNKYIRNLAKSLKGNTIILVNYVENHAIPLYDMFDDKEKVHLIHGKTKKNDDLLKLLEEEDGHIVIATSQLLSTGVSVKNLHNIIKAHPNKGRINNLQTIGRGLRLHDSKNKLNYFDIADNMIVGRRNNHTLKHFMKRIEIYENENFDYKVIEIDL